MTSILVTSNTIAAARVMQGIMRHLDPRRQGWRKLLCHSGFEIANPKLCPLCIVETAFATGNMANFKVMRGKVRNDRCFEFKQALECAQISKALAIELGFLRSDADPSTFYAALRYHWNKQIQNVAAA